MTVPNGPSQQMVVKAALADGDVTIASVGYIEAHGTGTPLGDPIEVNSLAAVFGGRATPLVIGACKTNIGHLEGAAGIAGLVKLSLCVQHGSVPQNLSFNKLNPSIDVSECPVIFPTSLTPWPTGYETRIGGVSSFGFAGTNVLV